MQLCRVSIDQGRARVGVIEGGSVAVLSAEVGRLRDLLLLHDVKTAVKDWLSKAETRVPLAEAKLLAPIDDQEVWAAGVTYTRSRQARMDESEDAANFYDKVYTAPRPEIFFKATPNRVVGPNQPIRIRRDSKWSVPEPELTLVLTPDLRLVGFTVGNDMSARDIEGENPLYLPQAKVYRECAGLGPAITLAEDFPAREAVGITLEIARGGKIVFRGETRLSNMKRTFDDLIHWIEIDNEFATGAFLMTGTGIVPPDEFSLAPGDRISITIDAIGTLTNEVVQAK